MRISFLCVLTLLVLVGCGADPAERASSSSDAAALLRSTVANAGKVKSAVVDLQAATGDGRARVQGPIVAGAAGELPRLALSATVTQGGKAQRTGVTWTGSRGFVIEDGKAYEIPATFVQMLTASARQSLGQGPLLGLDVTKWITDPRNAGLATVGGVPTVKISGKADMAQIEADLAKITAGLPGVGSASGATGAIKNATVDVYTGANDQILRRLVVNADVQGRPTVFDLTLTKVGEAQQITAPKDARPFSELMSQAKGLDQLAIK